MPADPAFTLAEHVCQTTFAALPASAVYATKRDMLDTLGAALGGSVAPGVAELCRIITHWGGRAESSVWLLGGRVPAPQAALAARLQGVARDHTPEGWAQITVQRRDGRVATLETTSPSGSPELPLSDVQLQAKFRDCAAHAVRPIPAEVVERAIQLVYHVDEIADAVELVRLFT